MHGLWNIEKSSLSSTYFYILTVQAFGEIKNNGKLTNKTVGNLQKRSLLWIQHSLIQSCYKSSFKMYGLWNIEKSSLSSAYFYILTQTFKEILGKNTVSDKRQYTLATKASTQKPGGLEDIWGKGHHLLFIWPPSVLITRLDKSVYFLSGETVM